MRQPIILLLSQLHEAAYNSVLEAVNYMNDFVRSQTQGPAISFSKQHLDGPVSNTDIGASSAPHICT